MDSRSKGQGVETELVWGKERLFRRCQGLGWKGAVLLKKEHGGFQGKR